VINILIDVQSDDDATFHSRHEWAHSTSGKSEVHGPLLNKRSTRRHSQNLVNIATRKGDLESPAINGLIYSTPNNALYR
jgi:hypothetical protein